jgi:hypothetical protein
LGSCLKISEVAKIFVLVFSTVKDVDSFRQKMGWATLGATFSQTRLVTLEPFCDCHSGFSVSVIKMGTIFVVVVAAVTFPFQNQCCQMVHIF